MFRRRKRQDEAAQNEAAQDEVGQDEAAQSEAELGAPTAQAGEDASAAPVPPGRPQGPWDEADAPDDELQRVDLGALRVPIPPDAEVRVDVDQAGSIVAATIVRGTGQVQVNVFAAPRSEGIWTEVREEIAEALQASGGRSDVRDGAFGPELHALVPTEVPGRGVALAPARFVGVDGPRWFLRALFTAAAATDPEVAAPLEEAVRGIVVVRGGDPMAVRDPLPLRLPPEAEARPLEAAGAPAEGGGGPAGDGSGTSASDQPSLAMPERGPEITETR